MRRLLRAFACIFILLTIVMGCAGGSKGTGGSGFDGTIITKQSAPLSGVIVTLKQGGASDITDVDGRFHLDSAIPQGTADLEIDTGKFSKEIAITITSATTKVTVVIQVDEENEDAEAIDINEEHNGQGGQSEHGD